MFGIWPGMGDEGGNVSETMQTKVDTEIRKIVEVANKKAQEILKKEKIKLDKVAKALLDKETLDTDEFEKIVGHKKSV
jgi:cell division protease FtsH